MNPMLCHGCHEDARLAHWKFYTVAEKDPEYMDRYSIAMERLKTIMYRIHESFETRSTQL